VQTDGDEYVVFLSSRSAFALGKVDLKSPDFQGFSLFKKPGIESCYRDWLVVGFLITLTPSFSCTKHVWIIVCTADLPASSTTTSAAFPAIFQACINREYR